MKSAIQDFFDLYRIDLESKRQLITVVKNARSQASTHNYFSWVEKNNAIQCQWALEQLKTQTGLFSFFGPYRLDAEPISDKYGAFVAMTDTWNATTDQKELLSRRMQDNWRQFTRETTKAKKNATRPIQANVELTGDLEGKLSSIQTERNAKSRSEVLRLLIEEEYERLCASRQNPLPLSSTL